MADKVRVWFDAEADYLEVRFSDAAGHMRETKHEAVMERLDAQVMSSASAFSGLVASKRTSRWKLIWWRLDVVIPFNAMSTISSGTPR